MTNTLSSRVLRLAMLLSVASVSASAQNLKPLRPPAVPLVAHDPYFSIWSTADRLNDAGTRTGPASPTA